MLDRNITLSQTASLLKEFIGPMLDSVDKPRKRFLVEALTGILCAGSLCIKKIARWISDDCSDIFYRVKRLLNHLVSQRGCLREAVKAYRLQCAGYIQPDTPLVIDLTDLAKPRARRMEYVALVYDGSEDKLVNGYLCLEVYAYLDKKRILPLALDAFSIDDPAIGSRNLQIYRTVRAVNETLDGKGVWIADCGFDAVELYKTWFSLKSHFVVRQRGDRCVITCNGVRIVQSQLVEHLRQLQMQNQKQTNIVFASIRLPDRKERLYLIASWKPGNDKPLILMTTLVVETLEQAKQILWYYKQRWSCEETSQFLKSRIGLERFRVRCYKAIQRLMILAMFAMGFLTWILLRSKRLTAGLFSLTSRFRKNVKFVYYRLLDGLQQIAPLSQQIPKNIPLKPPQNG